MCIYCVARHFSGDDSMQFYNSLNKSIGRASQRATPLSMLHRATPLTTQTHRATPVRSQPSPYEPPTPWRDYSSPYYSQSFEPPTGGAFPADGFAHTDLATDYPVGYMSEPGLPDIDCNAKYSTGSADSGVHSNSPGPRARTPTDFSDHQISPNDELRKDLRASQNSLNKKTVKNETYV